MTFEAAWPWWVVLGLVGGASLVAYRAYSHPPVPMAVWRRLVLGGLRWVTLLLILAFWLRPVVLEPAPPTREAVVPVLLDGSRSMQLTDGGAVSRLERARQLLSDELLPALASDFQVEVLTFADTLMLLPATELAAVRPRGQRTDLSGAIAEVGERYRGQAVAGVVVISDGGDTGTAGWPAHDPGFPVFSLGVGAGASAPDQEVLDLSVAGTPVRESLVELAATVVSRGRSASGSRLRLLENGLPVQVRSMTDGASGAPTREIFRVAPRRDVATLYTVEIPVAPDDRVPENNRRSVLVPPTGPPRHVLLIEGAPGHEHSFLKRTWMSDPAIDVDSVVRKGVNDLGEHTFYIQAHEARAAALATGFPRDPRALFAYDAVVLANVDASLLRQEELAQAAEFVSKRGGGLLVLGARSFVGTGLSGTPLEPVLPVELSGRVARVAPVGAGEAYQVTLTPDGEAHPIMQLGDTTAVTAARWRQVPALSGVAALGGGKSGASLLAVTIGAGGGTHPLVAVHRFGRGRAMVFTGEASWRWQMMLPAADDTYERFWRQAGRWLTGASPAPVAVSVTGGRLPGERAIVDILARDARFDPLLDSSIVVRLVAPGGATTALTPVLADGESGRYVAQFVPAERGVYRLEVETREAGASPGLVHAWTLVGGAEPEFADPRLNAEVLSRLSAASGGAYVSPDEVAGLADTLRRRGAVEPAAPIRRELWHGPWTFGALVGLLSLEWILRRRWGLR